MPRTLESLRLDSAFWRRLAWLGAARGPRLWLRLSPPPIGLMFGLLAREKRRHVKHNLRSLRGRRWRPLETVDVARTFMTFASSLADSFAVSENDRYRPVVDVEGHEGELRRALQDGSGAVIVTAHTAGWEVALQELRNWTSLPVMVVMEKERDEGARAFHSVDRQAKGTQVVVIGDNPLGSLPLLGQLRRGGVVAVQIDRSPPGMRCRTIQVAGFTWRIPEGPFQLASLSGAPLFSVFASRSGFLAYRLRISPPCVVPKRVSSEQLDSAAGEVAMALDDFVRENLTQWFHFVD